MFRTYQKFFLLKNPYQSFCWNFRRILWTPFSCGLVCDHSLYTEWSFWVSAGPSHEKKLRTAGRHLVMHMSIISLHWKEKTFDCTFGKTDQLISLNNNWPHVLVHGWFFNHWTFSWVLTKQNSLLSSRGNPRQNAFRD